jgi:hypothetical protein
MAPPNTPPNLIENQRSINHMESKKFYIVLTAVIILAFFYFSSVLILFFIPHIPEFVSGFVTIFSKTIEILAIIIASYVGAQSIVDFKYASASSSSLDGTTHTEFDEKEVTVIHTNAKEEDYELK